MKRVNNRLCGTDGYPTKNPPKHLVTLVA